MGNKKQNNNKHQSLSFEQMVSKAALAQMKPDIALMVSQMGRNVGAAISQKLSDELNEVFARIIVLEKIVMDKLGYTTDQLVGMVADAEDEAAGLVQANTVEKGDVIRLEIKTKAKEDKEFPEGTKVRIDRVGSGATLGAELEGHMLGMTVGELKTVEFGEGMSAELKLSRCARKPKVETKQENKDVQNNNAQQ